MSKHTTIGVVVVVALIGVFLWWMNSSSASFTGVSRLFMEKATTTDEMQQNEDGTGTGTPARDVASIAASLSGGSSFASYFASTGVKSSITGTGPYTIFVPTNGAISLLKKGTISGLSAAAQKRLVEYHIVDGRKMDIDAVQSGSIEALSGDMLNFEVSAHDKTARVNSQFIVETHQGSNGVVYVINGVLFPPEQ